MTEKPYGYVLSCDPDPGPDETYVATILVNNTTHEAVMFDLIEGTCRVVKIEDAPE
jgi:hypothetical protein